MSEIILLGIVYAFLAIFSCINKYVIVDVADAKHLPIVLYRCYDRYEAFAKYHEINKTQQYKYLYIDCYSFWGKKITGYYHFRNDDFTFLKYTKQERRLIKQVEKKNKSINRWQND